MIEKERLEELIEQGNMIWDKNILAINLMNFEQKYNDGFYAHKTYIKNNQLICEIIGDYDFTNTYSLEDLFETKEDAEEYAEFGNIQRTERLPYFPKYENIEYERGHFIRKFHIKDNYDGFGKLMVIKDYVILVQCSSLGVLHEEYFNKPLTRENYNEARRICVKLFKGEEV